MKKKSNHESIKSSDNSAITEIIYTPITLYRGFRAQIRAVCGDPESENPSQIRVFISFSKQIKGEAACHQCLNFPQVTSKGTACHRVLRVPFANA